MPTEVLSSNGPPPDKKWKGEGEVIEFESIPTTTIKDIVIGKVPEKTKTIWGTLNFPANTPAKKCSSNGYIARHGRNRSSRRTLDESI